MDRKIKNFIIKSQLQKINKFMEETNMKQFNKTNYDVKRLQPKAKDVELNKCIHTYFDEDNAHMCAICGTNLKLDFSIVELEDASQKIIEYLETCKMILNSCSHPKIVKAAQKYIDMIPLLKNIPALYDISAEEFRNASVDSLEEDTVLVAEFPENEYSECGPDCFINSLALEDESEEDLEDEGSSDE